MSEYNKFLSQFNKSRRDGIPSSGNEDVIPLRKNPEREAEEEVTEEAPITETEEKEISLPTEKAETDTIPPPRFIKTGETPFISVKHQSEEAPPTAVEKFTDRLTPSVPEQKPHTGYTGKINTYAANHSAPAGARLIREEEKPAEDDSTRIFPEESFTEKKPDSPEEGGTKKLDSKGDLLREIAKTSGAAGSDAGEIDEEALKKELNQVREKRIKDFRFWTDSVEETSESEDKSFSTDSDRRKMPSFMAGFAKKFSHLDTSFVSVHSDEYTDPKTRRKVFSALIKERKNVLLRTLVLGVLGLIMFIINLAASLEAGLNNGFFTLFGGNTVVYNIINMIFLISGVILMWDDLKKGLFSLLKLRPKTDAVLLFMYVSAFVQNLAAFFTLLKNESDFHLMTGAVLLLGVPLLISKVFFYDSTRQCFKSVAAASDKSCLRKVSDKSLVASLLKDSSPEETNVVYKGRTRFISSFIKRSGNSAFAAQTSSRGAAASAAVSLIIFIAAAASSKSFMTAISYMTMSACLSLPLSCLISSGYILSKENAALSLKSSFIQSFSDARDFCSIDDIVLSDADLFNGEITGTASASGVSNRQASFCACSLINKTEGLLRKAFSREIEEFDGAFPDAETPVYEDKLGYSAWIKDCRVLLGSRDFLLNHSVDVPSDNMLPVILEENSKPLYLAIEGHFAAVFGIKYSPSEEAAKNLRELAKSGTNILLSTSDPNIDEAFSEKLLALPSSSLRIMTGSALSRLNAQKNTITDSEEAGIVFPDSFEAFTGIVSSAIKLERAKKLSKLLTEAGIFISLVPVFVLACLGSKSAANVWFPILIETVLILLCFFITGSGIKVQAAEKLLMKPKKKKLAPEQTEEYTPLPIEKEEEAPGEKPEEKPEEKPASVEAFPQEVIDFSAITGEEEDESEVPADSEMTVTAEMLDSFAEQGKRHRRRKKAVTEKKSLFSSLFSRDEEKGNEEEEEEEAYSEEIFDNPFPDRKTDFANPFYNDGDFPPPPRFDLTEDKAKEDDGTDEILNASFVPPESQGPTAVYDDDYFREFSPEEKKKKKKLSDSELYNFDDIDI